MAWEVAQGAMASRAVLDYLVAATDRVSDPASCAEVIEDANQHLYALMQQHDTTLGMGTTLVGAVPTATALITFNVGDSRCYLHSNGKLIQLSQDDVVNEATNLSGRRRSHAITQSIGGYSFHKTVETHIDVGAPLQPDEALLPCSDGLTDLVSDGNINRVLAGTTDPALATRRLAALAFRHGGHDNISIVVARRQRSQPPLSIHFR
jgi:serine/threonine protein phosphatase PrpC